MLPRKIGPFTSHLRRLLSELIMNPPFLVAMSSATVSVFVFAVAGFFADDFMLMTSSEIARRRRRIYSSRDRNVTTKVFTTWRDFIVSRRRSLRHDRLLPRLIRLLFKRVF